ncbi:hypothetical protein RhiirA4_545464, partial [Rhizophagus irregularis]
MYYKKFLKQSDAQLKVSSEIRAQLPKEISDDTILKITNIARKITFQKLINELEQAINTLFTVCKHDNVAHRGDRAVKSRKEITWDVINQLVIAFDNPMDNSLFKDISGLSNMTAEYTSEGWTRLFNCYSIGEERLNVILQQDILKREKRVAKGRRAKNIGHHKIANMKKSNNNTRGRGRG